MRKILIIDDDVDVLELVKLILLLNNFDVVTHSTALNVDDVVMNWHPDLILLDVRLPQKSGIQVCRELKKTHTIPIILFSAHDNEQNSYRECGAVAFISKPFDLKHLLNTIHSHLN